MQQRRSFLSVCLLTLLGVGALSLASAAQTKVNGSLPDSPAGKTFGEFLKAFNSGNLETLKKFHRERDGNEANADKDMSAYEQSGGLTLHSVKVISDYELEALVQAKNGARWLTFTFNVAEEKPHPITTVRVQRAEAPSDGKSGSNQ